MVTDFHTHIFPPWSPGERRRHLARDATFSELYTDPEVKLATAEDLLAAMDKDGVDRAVVLGIGWNDQGLAREANDYIIESVARHPGRLVGFCGLNPAWGDAAAREAERCGRAGLRGIGELHPDTQSFDLGDMATMAPVIETVRELGMLVTTHVSEPVGHHYRGKGRTTPDVAWRFISNFPDVPTVCAHWGGGLPFYALMPEVASDLANVYFDTAASPFLYASEVFSVVAGLVGADRILLGSDYPLLRPGRLLRQVQRSSLSPTDKDAITRSNAARLLGD